MSDHSMQRHTIPTILSASILATCTMTSQLNGQEDPPARPAGLLPVPSYDGDAWTRSFMLGDLGGMRTDRAQDGIQFNIDWTQTVQSIVDGGRDETTRYGGALDFNMTLDLQRMDIMPMAMIVARAESRYGGSVNRAAGPLLPVNNDAFFPIAGGLDEDVDLALTSLTFLKILSPKWTVFLGKIDTIDGDLNEFASGRGMTQFQNAALNFNPVATIGVPYSTLAVGALWKPNAKTSVAVTVMNSGESSTTSGFGAFGDGWNLSAEAQFQYRIGNLPGGQNIGGMWGTDRDFLNISSRLVFQPGVGFSAQTTDDTWFVYWSGWQYLWTEEKASDGPMDLTNRIQDLQGVGIFARAGFADRNTNPTEWSASVGLGGRGVVPGRDDDTCGIAYYFTSINDDVLTGAGIIDDDTHGFETYYNVALTPSASFTLDGQVVEDAFPGTDTAVILGARLNIRF